MNRPRSTTTGTSDLTPDANSPLLVDRREAARLLSISPGSIDNMRIRGELPSLKLLGRRLFDVADLRKLIETRKEVKE